MTPPEAPLLQSPGQQVRSSALDVLRGVAIVTMVLSGTIPYKVLPAWMYHAQLPPPTHKFDPMLAGLSWVDFVFPFFLFSLGAALPLAQTKKLLKPGGWRQALADGIRRFGLLLFFAVATFHLNPNRLNGWNQEMGNLTWAIGPAACVAFTLILGRFPSTWPTAATAWLRVGGWTLAAVLLATVPLLYGRSFSLKQADIILVVLSNVALFGTLIMILLHRAPHWRWAILILGLGLHMARRIGDNPIQSVTDLKPLSAVFGPGFVEWIIWGFHPRYLKYLFIVIPGMAAGDILVRYLAQRQTEADRSGEAVTKPSGEFRFIGWGILGLALLGTALFLGFHQNRILWAAMVTVAMVYGFLVLCIRQLPQSATRQALTSLLLLAGVATAVGFGLEPYQGGAKKDHATLSYYAFGVGFAALNLAGYLAVESLGKLGPFLRLMAANGQNPMLAYIAAAFLVQPILRLLGVYDWIIQATPQPWIGAGRALALVLLGSGLVAFLGSKRIVWRS